MRQSRDGPGIKILAVEDSASARELLQAILLRLGVGLPNLRLASNSTEALRILSEWAPDLVFVDVDLSFAAADPWGAPEGAPPPALDGDDLVRVMFERNPRLQVVLVTAYDRDIPRVKNLLSKGVADIIVKPVLAARVKEILDRFSPHLTAAKTRVR